MFSYRHYGSLPGGLLPLEGWAAPPFKPLPGLFAGRRHTTLHYAPHHTTPHHTIPHHTTPYHATPPVLPAGIDIAFIFDGTAYHTARDEVARIRPGTLQVLHRTGVPPRVAARVYVLVVACVCARLWKVARGHRGRRCAVRGASSGIGIGMIGGSEPMPTLVTPHRTGAPTTPSPSNPYGDASSPLLLQAMGDNVLAAVQEFARVLATDPAVPSADHAGGSVYFDLGAHHGEAGEAGWCRAGQGRGGEAGCRAGRVQGSEGQGKQGAGQGRPC